MYIYIYIYVFFCSIAISGSNLFSRLTPGNGSESFSAAAEAAAMANAAAAAAAAEEVHSSDLSADETVEALYGPKSLPGNGKGTITAAQRKVIKDTTGCSAAVRKRDGWECRKLTVHGKTTSLQSAKMMAHAFILESQKHEVDEPEDTPGADGDPDNTQATAVLPGSKAARRKRKREYRKAREREAASSSSAATLQPLSPWMPLVQAASIGMPSFAMRPPFGYHCIVCMQWRGPQFTDIKQHYLIIIHTLRKSTFSSIGIEISK